MKIVILLACLVVAAVALPVIPVEVENTRVADLVGAEQYYGGYGGRSSSEYYGNYGYGGYGGYGNYYGGYGGYGGYYGSYEKK